MAPYLSRPVRESHKNYTEKITGKSLNRFRICLEDTRSKFQYVSETILIRQYAESIDDKEEKLVSAITDNIASQLEEITWSSNDTKYASLQLYQNIESVLGGVDTIFEDSIFTDFLHVGDVNTKTKAAPSKHKI